MHPNWQRSTTALTLAAALAAPVAAQVPPPEMKTHVLTDVGPLPAPPTCGCVTDPFKLTPIRPGWGYGGGPASPDTDAVPTTEERRFQRESDRETVQTAQLNSSDGLDGNYNASFGLGLELTSGTAFKRDDEEAAKWFLLSAIGGHPDAQVQAGHRYHRGLGLPQDDAAAAYWFHQAAKSGNIIAMTALGRLYAAGRGVPQDWAVAVSWWRKANNHRLMGDAYACGFGVEQDDQGAAREYQKAVDGGDMTSAIELGHMHAGKCASGASDEAAFKWYEKAAQAGYPEAQVALADLYLQGRAQGGPLMAYLWAKLAELRLPAGDLRTSAATHAAAAARRMSPAEIADTNAMVKDLIVTGTSR